MQLLALFGLLLIVLLFVSITLEVIVAVRNPDLTPKGVRNKRLVRALTITSSVLAVGVIGIIYYVQHQGV